MLLCLLQKKSDINVRDKLGRTPVMSFAWTGYTDVYGEPFDNIRALIETGADLDVADISDTTALTQALSIDRSEARGLYPLFLIAGAQKLHPDDYTDKVTHGAGHLSCLRASYPELMQRVEEMRHLLGNNDEDRERLRTRLLPTEEYAEIMRKRLANLTDPKERVSCAVRLHCLEQASAQYITEWRFSDGEQQYFTTLTDTQEKLEYILQTRRTRLQRFKTSWNTVAEVAPIANELDYYLPEVLRDIVLDYALIPGPILQKKPLLLEQKENTTHEDTE